jgi:DNA-binding FrmR family transcriptional regulator
MHSHDHVHTSHPEIVKRLKRANGHVQKIIHMIEHGEPCLDVAQQLQAVYSAIGKAKLHYVQDHIQGCLDENILKDPKAAKQAVAEFKEITKYL